MEHSRSQIHVTITQLKICNCFRNSIPSLGQTAFSSFRIGILSLTVCYSIGQILETFSGLSEIALSFTQYDGFRKVILRYCKRIIRTLNIKISYNSRTCIGICIQSYRCYTLQIINSNLICSKLLVKIGENI